MERKNLTIKQRTRYSKSLMFVVLPFFAVTVIFGLYANSASVVFAAAFVRDYYCIPHGDGQVECCTQIKGTQWCTICDDTKPPSNCGQRFPEPLGVAPPPPSSTTCPDNTALDANGNCAPVTQSPKGPASTDQGTTLSPSTDVNKPSVKDNANPLSPSTSQRVFSPTGGCVPGGTTCLPCDPGLPGANCIPSGDWHPPFSTGGGSEGGGTTSPNVQPPAQGGAIEQPPSNVAPPPSPSSSDNPASNNNLPTPDHNKPKGADLGQLVGGGGESASKKGSSSNNDNSPTPPACPNKGPIPPNCTLKPKF